MSLSESSSLKHLTEVLHSGSLLTHVFFILTSLYAFAKRFYLLGAVLAVETIFSFLHHLDVSKVSWTAMDLVGATAYGTLLLFYVVRKMTLMKDLVDVVTAGVLVILSLGVFFVARSLRLKLQSFHKKTPSDPVTGAHIVILEEKNDSVDSVATLQYQVEYLFYHVVWHVLAGLSGLFVVSTLGSNLGK